MTKKDQQKLDTRTSYFRISQPSSLSAEGLFDALQKVLEILGFTAINTEERSTLVGIETDEAAVNIARAGLKGLVEEKLPWVFWSCGP